LFAGVPDRTEIRSATHQRSESRLNFVVAAVGGERVTAVAWRTLPFLGWALVVLLLIIVFPPLTTWLPGTIR